MRSTSGRSSALRLILVATLLVAVGWVMFFDSHSIVKRLEGHSELRGLDSLNVEKSDELERMRLALDRARTDAHIEQIAREQYGMRRPGETVYRVEEISTQTPGN